MGPPSPFRRYAPAADAHPPPPSTRNLNPPTSTAPPRHTSRERSPSADGVCLGRPVPQFRHAPAADGAPVAASFTFSLLTASPPTHRTSCCRWLCPHRISKSSTVRIGRAPLETPQPEATGGGTPDGPQAVCRPMKARASGARFAGGTCCLALTDSWRLPPGAPPPS